MRTDLFDFELPDNLIALRPLARRDAARLLTVTPDVGAPRLGDTTIAALPELLQPGDALVFNDTKVVPAFLKGRRTRGASSVQVSVNLLSRITPNTWHVLARPARRLKAGDTIEFGYKTSHTLSAEVEQVQDGGIVKLAFDQSAAALDQEIETVGLMPLPHYIATKRAPDDQDREDYQTVFADAPGAVAAPTAGLHFTPELLSRLRDRGLSFHNVTLHVGGGTFLPVKVDDTRDHRMHSEWGVISATTAKALNEVRRRGGKLIAIGTTSLRLLETAAQDDGTIRPIQGETDIFITPGYTFRAVDRLLTNFHLPKSTLFMLVSAFSGLDTMKSAYAHAIRQKYRFFSYGDATLLDCAMRNNCLQRADKE